MHRSARLIATAFFACAWPFSSVVAAAVGYYFDWYCPGCAVIGSGSSGREGPFGSPSACEAARASLGGSLNLRGCGPECFYPQLCHPEGTPEVPPAAVQFPGYPLPSIQPQAAPRYGVNGRPQRGKARRERDEAKHEAARSHKETPSATPPELAARWRNVFSRYELRKSAQTIEIVLAETCATADCSRKTYPYRPVFRGRQEGRRLVGVVLIHAAVESWQDGTRCASPAGELPIEGTLSGDGLWITWSKAEFPRQQGCRAAFISLGSWRQEP